MASVADACLAKMVLNKHTLQTLLTRKERKKKKNKTLCTHTQTHIKKIKMHYEQNIPSLAFTLNCSLLPLVHKDTKERWQGLLNGNNTVQFPCVVC